MSAEGGRDARSPRLVAIDGPASSGKTTLGRRVAVVLGLPFIDTGLFYRGVCVAAVRAGLDEGHLAAAGELARRTRIEINVDPVDPAWTVRVDGRDASADARDPRWAGLLSVISGIPDVRAALLEPQREAGAQGGVAVGRDCGTVVFPEAPLKIYLDAPGDVRTRRRAAQLKGGGTTVDAAGLHAEVAARDARDSQRDQAPLQAARDAHMIDTGRLGIEEMVEEALRLCRAAGLLGVGRGEQSP